MLEKLEVIKKRRKLDLNVIRPPMKFEYKFKYVLKKLEQKQRPQTALLKSIEQAFHNIMFTM